MSSYQWLIPISLLRIHTDSAECVYRGWGGIAVWFWLFNLLRTHNRYFCHGSVKRVWSGLTLRVSAVTYS